MGKLLPQRFTSATGLARGSATHIARRVLANDVASEPTRIRKTRVLLVDRTVGEVFMHHGVRFMFWDGWISLHVLPVTDVCPSVTNKLCSPAIFFSISSCPQSRWLMVLLSFSFVACHIPRFAHAWYCPRSIARKTLHSRPSIPLWIASGYVDEAFMHGHSRLVATRT